LRRQIRFIVACGIVGGAFGWMLYIASPKTYAATCAIYERRDAIAVLSLGGLPQATPSPSPNLWGYSVAKRIARCLDQAAAVFGRTNSNVEQRLEKMRTQAN
jgi:hypothetical protein